MQTMTRRVSNQHVFFLLIGAVALFFVSASTAQAAQSTLAPTLVKAARLLDPRTGNVLAPAAVLIEGGQDQAGGLALAD